MKAINRFYNYLEFKDIKPTRFEKDYGLSNGYLGTQLKRSGNLGEDVIVTIIDNCLDLSIIWLLTGNGEMLKKNSKEYPIDRSLNAPKFVEVNKTEHDKLLNLAESAILRSKELEGYVKTQQLTIDLLQDRLFRYESFETKNKWAAFKIPEPEKIEGK